LQPIVDGVQLNIEIDMDKQQTENVVQRATSPQVDDRAGINQDKIDSPS